MLIYVFKRQTVLDHHDLHVIEQLAHLFGSAIGTFIFGGQKFLDNQMGKVRRLRDEITRRGLKTKIQVDGGVSPKTAHIVAEAGADVLVAGSAVYGAPNPAEAIDSIRDKAAAAYKD